MGEGMAPADGLALAVDGRVASGAEEGSVGSDGAIVHAVQRTSIQGIRSDFIPAPLRCVSAGTAQGLGTNNTPWPILPFLPFVPGGCPTASRQAARPAPDQYCAKAGQSAGRVGSIGLLGGPEVSGIPVGAVLPYCSSIGSCPDCWDECRERDGWKCPSEVQEKDLAVRSW